MISRKMIYGLAAALIISIGLVCGISKYRDFQDRDKVSEVSVALPEIPKSITLAGSPQDRGRIHGEKLKHSIHKNIANYWRRITEAGYTRSQILEFTRTREQALQKDDPDMFIEIRAMAEASGASYDDLLALNLSPDYLFFKNSPEGQCTAWIAHGSASSNGNNLFHKNRDLDRDDQVVLNVVASGDDNAYKGLTTAGITGISIGINDKGLAMGNTYVDCTEINILFGKGSLTMTKEMLRECDSVNDVFDYFDNLLAGSGTQSGSNLLVVDAQQSAIIEHTGDRRSSNIDSLIVDGVGYRSNYYKVLTSYFNGSVDSQKISRYQAALDMMEAKKGSLTPEDFNELSRHHITMDEGMPSEHPGTADGSISNYHTLCSATFEIDRDYPGQLSVMWSALGTPCTSLHTPIHNGSTDVHNAWDDSAATWNLAETIRTNQDNGTFLFGSLIPHFRQLEQQMMQDRDAVRTTAYDFLQLGQTAQARAALTDFDDQKGDSVNQEMIRITENKFFQDSFHFKNGIDSSSNIDWYQNTEEVSLDRIIDPARIVTYDFNGILQSNPDFNVYETDVDQFLFEDTTSNRNGHNQATDSDYTAIGSSNNSRWETLDPGGSDEMLLWVEMVISEAIIDIDRIEFTFEGYSHESSDEKQAWFYVYLLKQDKVSNWEEDNSWTQVVAYKEMMNGADGIFSVSLNDNFENYIASDGSITWVVGTPGGHSDQIHCDYLKMDVFLKAIAPLQYQTSGELESVLIDYGVNLEQYYFKASHSLPPGTDIVYKILNSVGTELATLGAGQAADGYSLAGLGTIPIRLKAELSSTSSAVTPLLHDWTVFWAVPECASGVCCNGSGFFRDSSYTCGQDLDTAYSCRAGTNCGDDVYLSHLDQFCSGNSSTCDGATIWDGWTLSSDCSPLEVCSAGLESCQIPPDGDGDGLTFCQEFSYGTSDQDVDSDNDQMDDGWEVYYSCLNPLIDDSLENPDFDLFNNIIEYGNSTDPCTGDTISDTDRDGITDWKELYQHLTNPLEPDTDADGVIDGPELIEGTEPLDAEDFIRLIPRSFNYQARLEDNIGQPIDDQLAMTFSLFETAAGNTVLWQEGCTVDVVEGLFNVQLGKHTIIPGDIFNMQDAYLKMVINGEQFSPRTQALSEALSSNALRLADKRMESGTKTVSIIDRSSVNVRVVFSRLFNGAPRVAIGAADLDAGGELFIIQRVFDTDSVGFSVELESRSGATASGDIAFSWLAHGQ